MKAFLTLFIALLSILSLSAQSSTEYFNVGNPITYCGTKYYFAWSVKPANNYYLQEYLPEGETLEHYNQMFSVSVMFCNGTPEQAVQAKIAELEQRKKSDPVVNYKVVESNDGCMLEFIVSDSKNGEVNTVEVDVHHYRQMIIDGRNALVLAFYSCRAYGDDIRSFILSIPDKRNVWYSGMNALKLRPRFQNK